MEKHNPLQGIILSIVDNKGPHPKVWYPDFANLAQIHNSAVKSFSIMIGDRSYREKSLYDLTCFGILPFPDINSVGFIHFFGVENLDPEGRSPELPTTITLLFIEEFRDSLCKFGPKIHQLLERESKTLWKIVQEHESGKEILTSLFNKVRDFLETL